MPYSQGNSYDDILYLYQYSCFYLMDDIAVFENPQQSRFLNFRHWTLYHNLQRSFFVHYLIMIDDWSCYPTVCCCSLFARSYPLPSPWIWIWARLDMIITWSLHGPEMIPENRHSLNILRLLVKHSPNMVGTWSKHGPNMNQKLLKIDPKTLL